MDEDEEVEEESEEESEEEEEVDEEEEAEEALLKVQHLQQELDQCVHELRVVDENASASVSRNPAFRKMRAMVVEKLEALHEELNEARCASHAFPNPANSPPFGPAALDGFKPLVGVVGREKLPVVGSCRPMRVH